MNITKCRRCGKIPEFYAVDEFGILYGLHCECGMGTQEIISPSSTLECPCLDVETQNKLISEWNNQINK